MRIVVVTANLPHGANEAFIVPEIEEMIRAGHQVLLVPRSPYGPILHGHSLLKYTRRHGLISSGILATALSVAMETPRWILKAAAMIRRSRSLRIAANNLAVLPKAFWLAAIAKEWKAEHIHSHWAGTTATLAMIAAGIAEIPWSFTAHRWDIVENNLLSDKVGSARIARFISEDGLKMAQDIGIGAQSNACVLKMGVLLPASVRRLSGPWPIVLCPARLVEVKGHHFLLEAWRILHDRGVHGELWLAGDGELRPRLEATIHRLGLQNVVRILGVLPHERLMELYRNEAISVVVLASLDLGKGVHEGIPVALIEAMGHAIPVVATSTGAIPELVKPGTGILVPPANALALADAIENLLKDNGSVNEVGLSGRRHVVETHDLSAVVATLVNSFSKKPANGPHVAPLAV